MVWGFVALYVVALGGLLIGTFGLFGNVQDPLSGLFLIPLGLPWVLMVDWFKEPQWLWLTTAAPLINIAILRQICRRTGHAKPDDPKTKQRRKK